MNAPKTRPAPREARKGTAEQVAKGLTLGRLFGVEVRLDPSWFIIFLLVIWSLTGHYFMVNAEWSVGFRLSLAVVTALLFFASVLAHEFGHSLVANALNTPVKRITLFIFGGMAHLSREPKRARDEFLIAIAGPLVSFGLAALFAFFWWLGQSWQVPALTALGFWLGWINLSLAVFNLIPGYPLDGGRVLRAVVWGMTGNLTKATRTVSVIGQGVAFLFIGLGIWQVLSGSFVNGLWIAFIGWFLYNAAGQSRQRLTLEQLLSGRTVADVLLTDCPRVSRDMSLERLVTDVMLPSGRRCFPVMEAGSDHLLGLVTLHEVRLVPQEEWSFTSVAEVMMPVASLIVTEPDVSLAEALTQMAESEVNQLPVLEQGSFLGMLTRERLLNLLQTLGDLPTLPNASAHSIRR